jgi:hypothetical protein
MNEGNLFKDAAQAALVMTAAALVFLGGLGFLGFFFTDKAFHGESDALSAASAPSKEGKATAKKPPREAKPN